MFQIQFSGKIQAVNNRGADAEVGSAIEVDVVQKIFVNGALTDRNWRLYAPRHKEQWLKKQQEKGYSCIFILSDCYGITPSSQMKIATVHASGQLLELMTI